MDDDRETTPELEPAAPEATQSPPRWSMLWQAPTIVISLALIASGFAMMLRSRPAPSVPSLLDRVDTLVVAGDPGSLEAARIMLNETIRARLDDSDVTDGDRSRFYATQADWLLISSEASGRTDRSRRHQATLDYARAVDLGGLLDPVRLERWALNLIELGDETGARTRLAELEGLVVQAAGDRELRDRRNRVLRRLVEHTLAQPGAPFDGLLSMLDAYRADSMLSAADELWAAARQAEIRISRGEPSRAIDHILIDMRRIEQRAHDGSISFAPLYVLLGRAYLEAGEVDKARFALDQAEQRFVGPEPERGSALLLLGEIDMLRNRLDEALLRMDVVVRDFQETLSYLPALLRRAELRSVLGDHDGAISDYERLRDHVAAGNIDRQVTAERVMQSLLDRHAASLAMKELDLALRYAQAARALYSDEAVPPRLWLTLAVTQRGLGQRLTRLGLDEQGHPGGAVADVTPEQRFAISEHYRQAATAFVRHARGITASPGQGESWAESLWMAADSFDLAGRTDEAITHFHEYLASRAESDPRWPDGMFRLAQAYHAIMKYADAASHYEGLIEVHPESQFATRSHVPLARAYAAMGRRQEAILQLRDVVAGKQPVTPDAIDYRDALVELGRMHYEGGDYISAIERLDEALRRYPDDPRVPSVTFRLADAYRLEAMRLDNQLQTEPNLPPTEAERLAAARKAHLTEAMRLFNEAADLFDAIPSTAKERLERSMERLAWIYRADCAFELGDYEAALGLYDIAARRYADHHGSLNALIQMYNCYVALGDMERARAANLMARSRLEQLPDEAFEAPDALMDRAAWERWLANSPLVAGGGS